MRFLATAIVGMVIAQPVLGAQDSQQPRLAGIVVGPNDRMAIFASRSGDATTTVRVGEVIDGYMVQRIEPRSVIVVGPAGTEVLETGLGGDQPDAGVQATPPSRAIAPATSMALQAQTLDAGYAIARLAMQRDRCARSGALPGVAPDAEDRLKAIILAMSRMPPRDGGEAVADAPAGLLASALAAGWDRARRHRADFRPSGLECQKAEVLWRQQAGDYGL